MFSQDDDGQQGLVLALVFGLIAGVLALVIGLGIYQSQASAASSAAPNAAVPAAVPALSPASKRADAADAAQSALDAASIKIEVGVVKFYFASGQSELAVGAGDALLDLIKGARHGRKLVIAGFHDAIGDAAKNAELARQRALAVRDALTSAGVPAQQIELKKPEAMAGSGSSAEARRVEVSLQ